MKTIYLSLSDQVAEGTFFRKSPVCPLFIHLNRCLFKVNFVIPVLGTMQTQLCFPILTKYTKRLIKKWRIIKWKTVLLYLITMFTFFILSPFLHHGLLMVGVFCVLCYIIINYYGFYIFYFILLFSSWIYDGVCTKLVCCTADFI